MNEEGSGQENLIQFPPIAGSKGRYNNIGELHDDHPSKRRAPKPSTESPEPTQLPTPNKNS